MPPTGFELKDIRDTVVGAFDYDELDETLQFHLNDKLANVVSRNAKYPYAVLELLRWSSNRGLETELIRALGKARPDNLEMQRVAKAYGFAVPVAKQMAGTEAGRTDAADGGLEGYVTPHLKNLPKFNKWREKMERVEGQVCFITFPVPGVGAMRGTGFLVGPNAVLTNYHVLKPVLDGKASPAEVECRFDYKELADGTQQKTSVKLAAEWQVAHSRYSKAEEDLQPDRELPKDDELDFALVRLADAVGAKPWSVSPGKDAPNRGWVNLKAAAAAVAERMPIIIAQHPNGRPLELAIDTAGVDKAKGLWLNAAGNRLRYATNTEGGSSGSPCFDFDWRPVALHHYGDPDFDHRPPHYNQGVPLAKVRERIAAVGQEAALGGDH